MTNKDYINKYAYNDDILVSYYQMKDSKGAQITLDGIINPLEIDNRDLCSPTDDQNVTPHCAGFSCAQYLEALNWKKTGKIVQLDAHQIYAKAKLIDGMINEEGTLLESALNAGASLCGLKNCKVKTLMSSRDDATVEKLKKIIHTYDLCLIGCNICTGWYSCNASDYKIKHTAQSCGGHAIVCCGYTEEGFIIQNHWSKTWGHMGFAVIPYDVFKKEFLYAAWLTNMYDNID